jgi:ATP-dependent helicase HrpA
MLLSGSSIGDRWESVLMEIMAHRGFVEGIAWTRDAVEAKRLLRGVVLTAAAQDLGKWLPELACAFHSVRGQLESERGSRYLSGISDAKTQLSELISDETLVTTPWSWLQHFPRYLKGIGYRLAKLKAGGEARDRTNLSIVSRFVEDFRKREANRETDERQLTEYRWMIEELRISLFAQPLGVSVKVSPQRLEKMFESVAL